MSSPSKAKGDRAERELAALLSDQLGVTVRRKLGAGRKDDMGDLEGLRMTVVQVADRKDVADTVRHKPVEAERQRRNADEPFAVTFVRLRGGEWRAVMTVEQFATWYREAAA